MVRIKVAHKAQPTASLMFSPHFDDICDILMNIHMWSITWRFHHNMESIARQTYGNIESLCFMSE